MRRGEVWTVSGAGYAGKPHPAIIVQDDRFDATASVTVCAFTTDATEAPLFRPSVSLLMVDKLTTVSKDRLGLRLGRLDDADVVRLNRAVLVFLGLV